MYDDLISSDENDEASEEEAAAEPSPKRRKLPRNTRANGSASTAKGRPLRKDKKA